MSDVRRCAEARRGRITITRRRPGEPDEDAVRGEEAVSLVYDLTLAAWAWARQTLPNLARSELPYRFIPRRRT